MAIDLKLEKVIPTSNQIDILYEQLKSRKYTISHEALPSYEIHKKFVMNNPYRVWFLVKIKDVIIGNIYIQYNNSVGLNGLDNIKTSQLAEILETLFNKISPLTPVPSIRYKDFFFNISINNKNLIDKLSDIGYKKIQLTLIRLNKNNQIS